MSTSEDRKDSIQQVFAKDKPKFITVAVFVGALCATFFVQGPGRFANTDRSSEWFARIAVFLFSGALSAALLLLFMTQKKISASIKVSEKMLTDTDESEDYAQRADEESLTKGLIHNQVMPEEQDRKYEVSGLNSQESKKLGDEKANAGLLNVTSRNEGLMEAMGANMEKITANKVAQFVARLAGVLLILGVIGSIIIGFNPTENCVDFLSSELCEKDWTTSLTMGLVGLLLNSLVMLSILMVALYIQGRTSTTED
jgi:hypothetical protein